MDLGLRLGSFENVCIFRAEAAVNGWCETTLFSR